MLKNTSVATEQAMIRTLILEIIDFESTTLDHSATTPPRQFKKKKKKKKKSKN